MDLTSEFLKEHYLNGYFVDNERTQIGLFYIQVLHLTIQIK